MPVEKELISNFVRQLLQQNSSENKTLELPDSMGFLFALENMKKLSDFVGQPDIFKYINSLVDDNNPYKDIIIKRIYLQFASMPFFISVCDTDPSGYCDVDILEKSAKYNEISEYIDDLDIYSFVINDYDDINEALMDNLEDIPDEIIFNLCVLTDNKLRKIFVPAGNELLKGEKRKNMTSTEILNLVIALLRTGKNEEFDVKECLKYLFVEFFCLWSNKEYVYACAMLIIMKTVIEVTYCEKEFNKIFKKLKDAIDSKQNDVALNKILAKLYVENDVVMDEADDELLSFITKELSTLKVADNLNLSDDALYFFIYAYKLIINMCVNHYNSAKELKENKEENKEIAELKDEINELKRQIKELSAQKEVVYSEKESLKKEIAKISKDKNNDIKAYKKEIAEQKDKIKQLEKTIAKDYNNDIELAKLREFVYNQSLNVKNKDFSDNENEMFEKIIKENKILMFGGHIKMLERLHKQYSDIDTIEIRDITSFNEEIIKKYNLVCINTNFLNHGAYYKLMKACDRYSVDYIYMNNENIEKIKQEILNYFEK